MAGSSLILENLAAENIEMPKQYLIVTLTRNIFLGEGKVSRDVILFISCKLTPSSKNKSENSLY